MSAECITADMLRAALRYDPETGVFTRIQAGQPSRWVGKPAGFVDKAGYRRIALGGKQHLAHRLVLLYVYGRWPEGHIDHINGITFDNRLSNLREVTQSENMQNLRQAKRGSASGVLGVHKKSRHAVKPWSASITVNRKKIHLGCFDTTEEAHAAYLQAKRELHPKGML